MATDRRKPTDHEIVMRVIGVMAVFGFMLYGALSLSLLLTMWRNPDENSIVNMLITAVAGGAGGVAGFVGGVLSQTFGGKVPPQVEVTNDEQNPVPVEAAADGATE